MTSKELREKRAGLIAKARAVVEAAKKEDRGLKAEELGEIERIQAEAEQCKQQYEAIERLERQELELAAVQDPDRFRSGAGAPGELGAGRGAPQRDAEALEERRALAMTGWLLNYAGLEGEVRDEHRQAASQLQVSLHASTLQMRLPRYFSDPSMDAEFVPTVKHRLEAILNALSVGSASGGGFTVPQGFVRSLEIALLQFGGMRRVSTILRTSTGERLPIPTTDDSSNIGARVGENSLMDVNGQDVAFGSLFLEAYEYSSKFVRFSNQFARDTAINLMALLGRLLGERLGRVQNRDCTTGNGDARPKGIVPGSTQGVLSAVAATLDADEVIKLIHSVDPAYRTMPGFALMCHDLIQQAIELLTDSNGVYLLQPGLADGAPDRIRGNALVNNQDMDSTVATGNKILLAGDLSKYQIREVDGMRLERVNERFIEYNQRALIGFMAFDGGLLDAGTNPVKYYELS